MPSHLCPPQWPSVLLCHRHEWYETAIINRAGLLERMHSSEQMHRVEMTISFFLPFRDSVVCMGIETAVGAFRTNSLNSSPTIMCLDLLAGVGVFKGGECSWQ